jgi:hypothetical protein
MMHFCKTWTFKTLERLAWMLIQTKNEDKQGKCKSKPELAQFHNHNILLAKNRVMKRRIVILP